MAEIPKAGNPRTGAAAEELQVHLADHKHFGAALLFATGSDTHLENLRTLANAKGMRLEPDGLHRGRTLIAASETDIYRALGLPFIDPESPKDAARSNAP